MEVIFTYEEALRILFPHALPVGTEHVPVAECGSRVLAQEVRAAADVPPFDRSPYDGYALRASDTEQASEEHPVTLRILEEIPAGGVSHMPVTEGCAVKILTGAMIPEGADCVIMFEKTSFTEEAVTVSQKLRPGENIIYAGEDVKEGTVLAEPGTRIDAGLAGTIAAQNIPHPLVYKKPQAGIISTGSELIRPGEPLEPGKIYDSNRYTLAAQLAEDGCEVRHYPSIGDDTEQICSGIRDALSVYDVLVLTGGVSVGDYDLTVQAMEKAGAEILVHGVKMKPGMACAYGVRDGKMIIALSGNPASSLTNYYAIAQPLIRKIGGRKDFEHRYFPVTLAEGFPKGSPGTRFLRGRLDVSDGTARMHISPDQGNVVLSSSIGADVMALIPAGSGPVSAGEQLLAFLL